jgi:asparagine synthase (glutamine-hydrolysing)
MIFGCLSFSDAESESFPVDRFRKISVSEEITFHPVSLGEFSGGYYLNDRLPYTSGDVFYRDGASDTLVLLTGSVYNRTELLPLFNLASSDPDPLLIAELFAREGPEFVKRLNGDFAIFIFQRAKKQAYLFRDQVGIKPMAWFTDRKTLFFSSDIVGLCRSFSEGTNISSAYLMGYFKYIDYRKTPNANVNKLHPGHFIHFADNQVEITRYWEPEKIKMDRKLSHDRMLSELKSIVFDAVKIRCDSRFIAGAHVSSGIDSGIVSTLSRREYSRQDKFYGFSWSPENYPAENADFDERKIVEQLCQKAGISLIYSDIRKEEFLLLVSSFYDNQGYFSEDYTAAQAVQTGTNLIFSGWGGDEFISTGDRGIEQDLLRKLRLRTFFHRNPVSKPKKFVRNQLSYVVNPALGFLNRGTARSFRNDARYIKGRFKRSDPSAIRNFYFHTSRHQLHLRLLQFYHLQERCESWAVNGYRRGVEYRYPLLDRRIIEYMLKVPSELLCETDYYRPVLREISEDILPDEVRWNWSKNDPVYWGWMNDLFKNTALVFIDEINAWKVNPDLHFIDFNLLAGEIAKYKLKALDTENKILFRALVYIKAIHEFTLKYHDTF